MTLTEEGIAISESLACLVDAENGECFSNALYGLYASTLEGLCYVEGVASNGVLLCHHGWLVTPEGLIVDPTPCYYERSEHLGPAEYYPAEKWGVAAIRDIFDATEETMLPLLGWHGREFKHPGYRKAYRDAAHDTFPDKFAEAYLSQLNKEYPDEATTNQ